MTKPHPLNWCDSNHRRTARRCVQSGGSGLVDARSTLVRLLLVDDHRLFRQGLARLLRDHPTLEVVGEAATADEAVEKARNLRPEMVLLDVNLPGRDGIAALREIRSLVPQARVVMLSMSDRDEDLMNALQAGAAGYILKSIDFDSLVRSLEGAAAGQAALSRELTARVLNHLSAST